MLNTPIKPMLLEKAEKPFSHKDFIYEWKIDGLRCLMHIDKDKVSLFSRHGTNCTKSFSELQAARDSILAETAILDGELVVFSDGKPAFDLTMKRFMASPEKQENLQKVYPAQFIAWDIIFLNNKSLVNLPLFKRKELLDTTVKPNELIFNIEYIGEFGEHYFDNIKALGLEGIVCKAKDSQYYLDQRTNYWRKIKNYRYAECVILGYRSDKFGLYLGEEKDRKINYVGLCELGMNNNSAKAFYCVAKDIVINQDKHSVWLEPVVNCKIKHIGSDSEGRYREASFEEFLFAG